MKSAPPTNNCYYIIGAKLSNALERARCCVLSLWQEPSIGQTVTMNTEVAPADVEPDVKIDCWKDDSEMSIKTVADGGVKMDTSHLLSIETSDQALTQDDANPRSHHSTDSAEIEEIESSPSPLLATPHSGITLTLDNLELWNKFSAVATEMIITKSGR